MAVKPERPPTAIPAEDSTKAPIGDVPSKEPATIVVESAIRALPIRGILLFLTKPACSANPTKVPVVSKKVTSRKVNTTTISCRELMLPTCVKPTINVELMLGMPATMCAGMGINPVINPKMELATIPMKMAPGTLALIRIKVTSKPKMVSQVLPTCKEPSVTTVDLSAATRPPWLRPIKAMNSPIPALMAIFRSRGMASTTFSRNLKAVKIMKRIEATKTPARAVCQGTFIPMTTE